MATCIFYYFEDNKRQIFQPISISNLKFSQPTLASSILSRLLMHFDKFSRLEAPESVKDACKNLRNEKISLRKMLQFRTSNCINDI